MPKVANQPGAQPFVPKTGSLKQLMRAAQKCQGCELYRAATQAVLGEGPASAPIMLVGEQPGDREDLAGRPFVGPAGGVLDRALADAGIERSEVYLTNAVKHFKFEERGKRRIHKKPSSGEITACKPWLEAELVIVQPRLIVCLGATAARSVIGPHHRLLEERGRFFPYPPGGIHLLNGLYDAKLDGQPVLAITGMQFHDLTHTHTQQDIELDKLFMDVCVYNARCMGAAHLENIAALACRTALAYRGVAHLSIPVDFQESEVAGNENGRTPRNVAGHVSEVSPHSARIPCDDDLRKAADILNAGKRIAILAGRGALHAGEALEQVAEKLGAPVIKALLGKAALPDDSPYTTGSIGLLGTKPSQDAMEHCDTLLIAGSSFPYIEFMPKPDQARGVQIDSDPVRIGLRYPVEAGLVGDCRGTLEALLPLLRGNPYRTFLSRLQSEMRDWKKLMEHQESATTKPMKPQVVAAELGKRLPSNAIVNCDSGTITTWWARHVPVKRGQMHTVSGNLATMACGLPYTIAAQVAYPDRLCVGIVGDGGFSMLMAEFVTAVRYKLPIKILIIKNNSLGQIRWEQMVFLGNPEYGCDLTPINFTSFAHACGGVGFTIEEPGECGEILDRALQTPGPVLIEAVVDSNEPPMPPKVTARQAAHFVESLAKGTPDRRKILATIVGDKVREMV